MHIWIVFLKFRCRLLVVPCKIAKVIFRPGVIETLHAADFILGQTITSVDTV